jgi:hypothetical protein
MFSVRVCANRGPLLWFGHCQFSVVCFISLIFQKVAVFPASVD